MNITIDPELKALIPPLAADERRLLEESIKRDGVMSPLVLWERDDGALVLLDGHNRYEIATAAGMKQHPEQRDGEVYLGNMTQEHFDACSYKSKRKGMIALDNDGRPIDQRNWLEKTWPVFASQSEQTALINALAIQTLYNEAKEDLRMAKELQRKAGR